MTFIKDWENWLNYKKTIEKLSESDKVPHFDLKSQFTPKINIKPNFVFEPFQNKKVRNFDKSEMKRFKSEKFIDLHGYTREIDNVLENFCTDCVLKNLRFVTIITGKGTGIIKEATENWLVSHPEFIIAFSGIKDSMRQVGAYSVKLRTRKIIP